MSSFLKPFYLFASFAHQFIMALPILQCLNHSAVVTFVPSRKLLEMNLCSWHPYYIFAVPTVRGDLIPSPFGSGPYLFAPLHASLPSAKAIGFIHKRGQATLSIAIPHFLNNFYEIQWNCYHKLRKASGQWCF